MTAPLELFAEAGRGSPAFTVVVYGVPGPQGSKSGFINKHTGRVQMKESSSKVKPWREAVKFAALDAREEWRAGWLNDHWQPFDGPLAARMVFTFPRPAGHFGSGRNAGVLRPSAPSHHTVYPDLSKLVRSTEDALTQSGIWRDDARVVHLHAEKVYVGSDTQDTLDSVGGVIRIWRVTS